MGSNRLHGDHMLLRLSLRHPEAFDWVATGASVAIAHGIPLQRALGLASTKEARRRNLRDAALILVADLLGPPRAHQTAVYRRLVQFRREHWLAWQKEKEAPPKATDLERALFAAFKHGADEIQTPQGVGRILRKVAEAETTAK